MNFLFQKEKDKKKKKEERRENPSILSRKGG